MYITLCQQPVLLSQHIYILFCSHIKCAILLLACLHSSTLILHQLRHTFLGPLYILLTRQESSSSEARERKTIPGKKGSVQSPPSIPSAIVRSPTASCRNSLDPQNIRWNQANACWTPVVSLCVTVSLYVFSPAGEWVASPCSLLSSCTAWRPLLTLPPLGTPHHAFACAVITTHLSFFLAQAMWCPMADKSRIINEKGS